jgi:anti-sigma factor (TIGR02949 family)
MKPHCRRIAERLTAYLDDTLPREERQEVEQHLSACPPCRNAATEEEGGRAVLRACANRLRTASVPPELRARCEAAAAGRRAGNALTRWLSRLLNS